MKRLLAAVLCMAMIFLFGCTEQAIGNTDYTKTESASCDTVSDSAQDSQEVSETVPQSTESAQTTESHANEAEPEDEEGNVLRVLAIGNSFSSDATEYLWELCSQAGYDSVRIGNLFIGGCSLDKHWSNVKSKNPAYTYYKNVSGIWRKSTEDIESVLLSEKWDVITLQQASAQSGRTESFGNLKNLSDYVSQKRPDAKIFWHMTWAYQANSTHSAFPNYKNDQDTMYRAIVDAVDRVVLKDANIDGVIPVGTAIQNLRTSYIGDTLTRDGHHLSYDIGRYTAALTWFSYITGQPCTVPTYLPKGHTEESISLPLLREAVQNALNTPFEVTPSEYTEAPDDGDLFVKNGLNIDGYELLDLDFLVGDFYNSTLGHALCGASAKNGPYYSASRILTREVLPVGTVIILDGGYQYRPEGWIDSDTKNTSSSRPDSVSSTFTVITEEWWQNFTLRAFNLSHSGGNVKMTAEDSSALRIYVPRSVAD